MGACPADISGNGVVNAEDLSIVLSNWGAPSGGADADLNDDGVVNAADLSIVLSSWGSCTVTPAWAVLLQEQPDPAVVTSASLRSAIAATGYAWRVRDAATQIEMVLIPPGTYMMGCVSGTGLGCELDENPAHSVTLTDAFYIGRTEVTQSQWTAIMGSNPSAFGAVPNAASRPVESATAAQVASFLAATGLRLPFEAEWEYAYRAGTTTAFHGTAANPSGSNSTTGVGQIAWYSGNGNLQPQPVATKSANGFGLFDMSGNVWERTADTYASGYYSISPPQNPTGPASDGTPTARGGAYNSAATALTGSNRIDAGALAASTQGLRVARFTGGAPNLWSISPAAGPTEGGTTLRLRGANLSGTTAVLVGGVPASAVSVLDDATVTAVVPAGASGSRDVTLVNPRGSSTLASAFRYYIRPTWASVEAVEPDPSVVLNETIRFVIRSSGYPWRVRDSISGIELVLVPSGTMDMGCSASNLHPCAADESPVHPVTISDFMYVGRTEVTQQQWTAILGTNPSFFQGPSYPDAGGRPVEQVSWNAAQEFLVRTALRLPTEAEWEYLYRSNTSAAYHNWAVMPDGTNSETNLGDIAWFDANNGAAGSATFGTKLVARKFPNAYGLYDMAGNVAEWVSDYYSATYYASSPSLNPAGPASGTGRVYRGGSFAGSSNSLRASRRLASAPDQATNANGFRVVRGLQETPTLARVEPAFGPATGGTTITIRGTNLTGTTGIVVGGLAATSVTVVNDATVTAVTPIGAAGMVDVVVATSRGTATLADGFRYYATPGWATVLEIDADPSIVTDPAIRESIFNSGYPWLVRDNATGIEMVFIPSGAFEMGCSPSLEKPCDMDESPVHAVTIPFGMYMGRHEVTQAQWTAVMGSNPSFFQGPSYPDSGQRPVEQVSRAMVGTFLASSGLRLPTEAEWEYAYRANTETAFHGWADAQGGTDDDALVDEIAWWDGNNGVSGDPTYGTKRVALKAPNGFGLHDMAGNVAEFVADYYSSTYYASSPSVNPLGPASGTSSVYRGGWFSGSSNTLRASRRLDGSAGTATPTIGFRVVRRASAEPLPLSVTPDGGSIAGGTQITITGDNLLGTTSVLIGGVPAAGVTVVNTNTVTAITAPGTLGSKEVLVTTSFGSGAIADGFVYVNMPAWATLIQAKPEASLVTDAAARAAMVATGLPWRVLDTSSGIEMLLIPPGSFDMGCSASGASACDADESPVHTVTLSSAFYIGRYEVTQAQWTARMGSNPSFFQGAKYPLSANYPVETVSWNSVQAFLGSVGLRLPTEAEWEYACRAGTETAFHGTAASAAGTNDDAQAQNIAWFGACCGGSPFSRTNVVGTKQANGFALHDMSGNVWEWVADWYSSGYYASSPATDPQGPPSGINRVVRGGSWFTDSRFVRSSSRGDALPDLEDSVVGFRVARSP